jgi:hypothetical protein
MFGKKGNPSYRFAPIEVIFGHFLEYRAVSEASIRGLGSSEGSTRMRGGSERIPSEHPGGFSKGNY